jgi:hypothetical protein
MRAIAGALIVVAGAFLWGVGAVAATLAYGLQSGGMASYGNWAIFGGIALVLAGLGIAAADLLPGRPPLPPASTIRPT